MLPLTGFTIGITGHRDLSERTHVLIAAALATELARFSPLLGISSLAEGADQIFAEQVLKAGESRRMPVRFVVDPKLPADIPALTLSYTFYNNELATKKLAEQASHSSPAS